MSDRTFSEQEIFDISCFITSSTDLDKNKARIDDILTKALKMADKFDSLTEENKQLTKTNQELIKQTQCAIADMVHAEAKLKEYLPDDIILKSNILGDPANPMTLRQALIHWHRIAEQYKVKLQQMEKARVIIDLLNNQLNETSEYLDNCCEKMNKIKDIMSMT